MRRQPKIIVPLPDPTKPFEEQDPCVLLAMCIFGEARGQGMNGKLGVACVVRNRVASKGSYGEGFHGVILKPFQFSSFNVNDPNRAKLLHPLQHEHESVWEECYAAAEAVFTNTVEDVTAGACFYYSRPITEPPHAWGRVEETITLGSLFFCRHIR